MRTKKYRASPLTDKKKSNRVRRREKNIEQTENLPTPPSKIKWSVPNTKHSKQNPRQDPPKTPPYRVNTVAPEAQAPPNNAVPDDDDYYAFTTADNPQSPSTLPILIENKLIDVVVDSGASCNLISHEVFQSLLGGGGVVPVTACSKQVYPYLATKALDLVGMQLHSQCMCSTNQCKQAYIILYCSRSCSNSLRPRSIRSIRCSQSGGTRQ
jgi:hypothetical protein